MRLFFLEERTVMRHHFYRKERHQHWLLCYAFVVFALVNGGGALAEDSIQWTVGPTRVALGSAAQLDLPEGYRFADATGTRLFMEANGNPPNNSEIGLVIPPSLNTADAETWFIVFSYEDSGHVDDDEKASLDKDAVAAVLDSIIKGTERENVERAAKGWPALKITGWQQPPFYDGQSHHLTWAVAAASPGSEIVNYNSRVLGRTGVISANLVVSPDILRSAVPTYQTIVSGISFDVGHSYGEFREGDKVAKYGLIGLMTGGAAVVAVKAWGSLVKVGAVLVAVLAAGLAKLKSFFKPASPKLATVSDTVASPAPNPAAAPDYVMRERTVPGTGTSAATNPVVLKCPVCGQANRVRMDASSARPHCARCKASLSIG